MLLKHGATVDAADIDGDTALMEAAVEGNLPFVKLLLAKGANINARSSGGLTTMRYAIIDRNPAIVQELIKRGADVNLRDDTGHSPLMTVAVDGKLGIVRILLAHGAHTNARDSSRRTPLLHAFANECGHVEIIKLLIEGRADVQAIDNLNQSVAQCAKSGWPKAPMFMPSMKTKSPSKSLLTSLIAMPPQ